MCTAFVSERWYCSRLVANQVEVGYGGNTRHVAIVKYREGERCAACDSDICI